MSDERSFFGVRGPTYGSMTQPRVRFTPDFIRGRQRPRPRWSGSSGVGAQPVCAVIAARSAEQASQAVKSRAFEFAAPLVGKLPGREDSWVRRASPSAAALSQDRPVLIGHGDFAAIPAVAAGATRIGTGWDTRQRAFAYSDHAARPLVSTDGGSWYKRPTLEGLLGISGPFLPIPVTCLDGRPSTSGVRRRSVPPQRQPPCPGPRQGEVGRPARGR